MSDALVRTLERQFDTAWRLADHHLSELSTDECLWRPAAVGLHVWPTGDGRWRADWPTHEGYSLGPPSVAWVTWHMLFWWSMALDYTAGAGTLRREQVYWPGSAELVRKRLDALQREWRALLRACDDAALASCTRVRWPFTERPLVDLFAWANVELVKNAAELGYARFLHAVRVSDDA